MKRDVYTDDSLDRIEVAAAGIEPGQLLSARGSIRRRCEAFRQSEDASTICYDYVHDIQ
jgi:hypothetical protein